MNAYEHPGDDDKMDDPNWRAPDLRRGDTALHTACRFGHERVVRLLLMHRKANNCVNVTTSTLGYTPLMIASWSGWTNLVLLLLQHGADVNARSSRGDHSALSLAITRNHQEIFALLLQHGAKTQETNTQYFSSRNDPLAVASQLGRLEMLQQLLALGADPDLALYHSEQTPLFVASAGGHLQIVKALVQHGATVVDPEKCGTSSKESPIAVAANMDTWMLFIMFVACRPTATRKATFHSFKLP